PHKPKIDLCGDLGPAPDSDLVEFARTGRPPAPAAGDLPASAVPTMSEQAPGSVDEVPSASAHAAHADLRNLLDAEVATVAPPASTRPVRVRRKRSPGRLPLPWIIAGSLLLFLLITGGMIAAFVGGRGFKG